MTIITIEIDVPEDMMRTAELPYLKSWIRFRADEAVDQEAVNTQLFELRAAARDDD